MLVCCCTVDVHGHGRNGSIVPHIEPIGRQKGGHVPVGLCGMDPSRKDRARRGSVARRGGTGDAAVGRSTTPRRIAREGRRRVRQRDVVDALKLLGTPAVRGEIHFLVLFLEDLNDKVQQIAQSLDGRPGTIDHRVGTLDGIVAVVVFLLGSGFTGSSIGRCFVDQYGLDSCIAVDVAIVVVVVVDDATDQRRSMRIHARYLNPRHNRMLKGESKTKTLDLLQLDVERLLWICRGSCRDWWSRRMPHQGFVLRGGLLLVLLLGDPRSARDHVPQVSLQAQFSRTRRQTNALQRGLEGLAIQIGIGLRTGRSRWWRHHFGQSTLVMVVLKCFGHHCRRAGGRCVLTRSSRKGLHCDGSLFVVC